MQFFHPKLQLDFENLQGGEEAISLEYIGNRLYHNADIRHFLFKMGFPIGITVTSLNDLVMHSTITSSNLRDFDK